VKDLGNAALRLLLERPLLSEAIGQRIVSSGLLSAEAFADLREQALQDITAPISYTASVLSPTKNNTLVAGSWEMKELVRDDKVGFQVFSVWARDQRHKPIPPHRHEGVEFFITLAGAILLTVDAQSIVVKAPHCQMIPHGAIHSTSPLTPDASLLAIMVPPNQDTPSWAEQPAS
jgi:quercetin dioxygenase-like cupin family protein